MEDRKEESEALIGMTDVEKKQNGVDFEGSSSKTKIIFYDNKLSQGTKWSEMEVLISKARTLQKYQNITFATVEDFSTLTVAQQARTFNEADAVIMVHGEHMSNVIFAVDGTTFVEVGCKVKSLIGNPHLMEMIDGTYKSIEKCKGDDSSMCIACDSDNNSFTMSPDVFENIIDDVAQSLKV